MAAGPDVFRALGALCEPPDPAHAGLAAALGLPPPPDAATFTDVFVFQLVPYAAPYLSPDGMTPPPSPPLHLRDVLLPARNGGVSAPEVS